MTPLDPQMYHFATLPLHPSPVYETTLDSTMRIPMHPNTPPQTSPQRAAVKSSANKTPPRPQPWQKTTVVALKDFSLAEIRDEFECTMSGWATVDVEVETHANCKLVADKLDEGIRSESH